MNRNEQILCPQCQSDDYIYHRKKDLYVCNKCGCRFDGSGQTVSPEEKPFRPMKLFLSYGHTEKEIGRRIAEALKKRGHEVWFDEDKIHEGRDWRQEIADGLVSTNGVIACLSHHSVRQVPPPPSVCLEELSVAIGVRGGNIKTILLEPEKEVRPPASVCHIQWLDMSDWQAQENDPSWFNAKMEQLFQVVENDESREFTGQISTIQEKLHINYSTSKQRDLLQRTFVGREWLTKRLEAWLDDPSGDRLCVLYGDPGVGKSAFAANFIHYNPRVAAGLFCEYDRPAYNDARTVVMTLAYLLACRLPAYRTPLAAVLERENRLDMMNVSELFDLLLTDPLQLTIDGGHETLCIVIDGLDECAQGERNALAETLSQYVPRLPTWLRVLVTAREVSAVTGPLEGAKSLALHGNTHENQEDIRAYFVKRLKAKFSADPAWEKALDALTERSGGIFLYAQLVCDGILNGKLSIHDTDSFPEGLSGAFYRWFGWFFPDKKEYKEAFRLPLGALLASPEPLPTEELQRVFQWDDNQLEDFLRRVNVLLRRDVNVFDKETLSFTHQYLNEWLDTDQAGYFRSRKSAALEKMAERFYALFQVNVKSLTEYEALHLAALLKQCGMTAHRDEVILGHDVFAFLIDAGDHYRTWGKLPAARMCYSGALAMAEEGAEKRGEPDDHRDRSISRKKFADVLRAQGDPNTALLLYWESQDIRKRLAQEQGTSEDRRNLGVLYINIADILRTQGDLKNALAHYQESEKIFDQLVQEDDTPENRRNLSGSYERIAKILWDKGDSDGALDLYRKVLKTIAQLARELDTPDARRDLRISYTDVANILRAKGNPARALELYRKSLKIARQLAQERGTPEDHRGLRISCSNVAGILQSNGNPDGALELYQEGMDISEQLVQKRGIPADYRALRVSCNNVANILRAKGDLDEASKLYKKSLEIREHLVRKWGTPEDRRGLSASYEKTADISLSKGDLDKALELYRKSLKIRERLAQDPGTPDDCQALSILYNNIAGILETQDDPDGALVLYQKSLKIAQQLAQERGTVSDRDSLAALYLSFMFSSSLPDAERLDYAQQGLPLSEQLLKITGQERYQQFCDIFRQIIKTLQTPS